MVHWYWLYRLRQAHHDGIFALLEPDLRSIYRASTDLAARFGLVDLRAHGASCQPASVIMSLGVFSMLPAQNVGASEYELSWNAHSLFILFIYSTFSISCNRLICFFHPRQPFLLSNSVHILKVTATQTLMATCFLDFCLLFRRTLAARRCGLEFLKLYQERWYHCKCRNRCNKNEDTNQCPVVDLEHCTQTLGWNVAG